MAVALQYSIHQLRRAIGGYSRQEQLPLGGYAALTGLYALVFGGAAALLGRRREVAQPELTDVLLLGVATHKLSRIIARDWVTAPFRAPFTEYQQALSGGEVAERSRGRGLRRAVGDLVSCPFCLGPWVAGALVSLFAWRPRAARLTASAFAAVAASDFLHRAYEALGERQKALEERAQSLHPADSSAQQPEA